MNREELNHIIHFAEINGMMEWAFEDVLNEYLTTKEVAESYDEPLKNCMDKDNSPS